MTAHIGIVACSAEGAALCYRTICVESGERMGEYMHPELSMHTNPLGKYMEHIRAGDWAAVARLMLSSAEKLAAGGADFLICPDNTIHQAFPHLADKSPLPWLHIADCVAEEALSRGFSNLGILGTKYLMIGPVYPEKLERRSINSTIPGEADREGIDRVIFTELVNGIFKETSRLYLNDVIRQLGEKKGCDAVVLGCTELPLLVHPDDCPLPALDSTRLLARAAVRKALLS